MPFFATPDQPCVVCKEALADEHFAECTVCFGPYHLRMTQTAADVLECGTTFIHDEEQAMVFLCQTCFSREHAASLV